MNIFKDISEALKSLEDPKFISGVAEGHKNAFTIIGWYKITEDLKVYVMFSYTEGDDKLERWIEDGKPFKRYNNFQELIDDNVENDKYIIRKLYREVYRENLGVLDDDSFNYIRKKSFNMVISKENVIKAIKEVFN